MIVQDASMIKNTQTEVAYDHWDRRHRILKIPVLNTEMHVKYWLSVDKGSLNSDMRFKTIKKYLKNKQLLCLY